MLLTHYALQRVTYSLRFTTRYLLITLYNALFTHYALQRVTYSLRFTTCYLLITLYNALLTHYALQRVTHYALQRVTYSLRFTTRYLLITLYNALSYSLRFTTRCLTHYALQRVTYSLHFTTRYLLITLYNALLTHPLNSCLLAQKAETRHLHSCRSEYCLAAWPQLRCNSLHSPSPVLPPGCFWSSSFSFSFWCPHESCLGYVAIFLS